MQEMNIFTIKAGGQVYCIWATSSCAAICSAMDWHRIACAISARRAA